jgi:RHS repeat-associated protein
MRRVCHKLTRLWLGGAITLTLLFLIANESFAATASLDKTFVDLNSNGNNNISVSWSGFTGNVYVEFYKNSGSTPVFVYPSPALTNQSGASGSAGFGSGGWANPGTGCGYRFKVVPYSNSTLGQWASLNGASDFCIGSLTLNSPNGGESMTMGNTYSITWNHVNVSDSVRIHLYQGLNYVDTISSSATNNGLFSWSVPLNYSYSGSNFKIGISNIHLSPTQNDGQVSDFSNNDFSIQAPPTPLAPTGLDISDVTGGFRLSWNNASGTGGDTPYQIYWGNDNSLSETYKAGVINDDGTPSDHVGLVSGSTYCYSIKSCNGSSCSALSSPVVCKVYSPAPPALTPLYRSNSPTDKSHFYTISNSERSVPPNGSGYTFEKIEAYIYDKSFSDVVPLYRYYYPAGSSYYYTTNTATAVAGYKSGDPIIVGYVYPVQREYTVPMYHLYSNTRNDHFYTISEFERNNAVTKYSYSDMGIAFYVSRTPNMGPVGGKPIASESGVDLATGNFQPFHNHLDIVVPAGRGIPFIFARTYNAFALGDAGSLGEGWSHNYDIRLVESGGKALVKWGDGRIDEYAVSGGIYTPPTGVFDSLAKNGTTWTLTRTDRTTLGFNEYKPGAGLQSSTGMGRLSYLEDRNGNRSTLEYLNDYLWKYTDATGRAYGFTWMTIPPSSSSVSNTERIQSVYEIGLLGRTISFAYDTKGNLTDFRDAENNLTQYRYDSDNLLVKVILPKGNEWTFNYDQKRLASHSFGSTTTNFSRTATGDSSVTINPDTTTGFKGYSKNCSDNLTTYTLTRCSEGSSPATEVLSYDRNLPTAVKDGKGNLWKYQYNSNGNMTKATTPLNEVTDYQYTGLDLIKEIDPELHETSYEYDVFGNMTKIVRKEVTIGGTNLWPTVITYYSSTDRPEWKGLVKSVKDPRLNTTTYEYDTYGYLNKIIAPTSKSSSFVYDSGGRLQSSTDADGVTSYYTYDKLNRIKTATDNLNRITTYNYDTNGNLNYVLNPRNIKTIYAYKTDSELLDTVTNVNNQTNASVMIAKNDYDPLGRLTSLTNAKNKSWRTTFDADGHVDSQITPLGFSDLFQQYDANGNLTKQSDRTNRITNMTYLNNNKPDSKSIQGGKSYAYTWFKNGLPKTATGPNGTTTFAYTTLGQLKSSSDPFGKTVGYEYDQVGNLAKIIYPDTKAVTYAYNSRNLLETVTDWKSRTTTYTYSDAGRITRVTYPSSAYVEYLYDAYWRLKTINNKKADGTLIVGYTVDQFDELDAPKQITKTGGISATSSVMDESSIYDDNNRISSAGTATFSHNNLGEVLTKIKGGVTTTFTYDVTDVAGLLKGISITGGTASTYTYDAMGRRISATRGGVTTKYILDLSGVMPNALAETDNAGNITAYYVYGLGLITRIEADTANTPYYYHFDRSGNTVALTDATGFNVTDQYAYDADPFAFGITKTGTTPNQFTFVGKYGVMDEGDNIFYMRARYYDAEAGRFLSEDPIGFDGGDMNVYSYVGGNPIVRLDPGGLEGTTADSTPMIKPNGFREYGNWCGPNWTGGQVGTWDTIDKKKALAPIDEQDKYCEIHDKTFSAIRNAKNLTDSDRSALYAKANKELSANLNKMHDKYIYSVTANSTPQIIVPNAGKLGLYANIHRYAKIILFQFYRPSGQQ